MDPGDAPETAGPSGPGPCEPATSTGGERSALAPLLLGWGATVAEVEAAERSGSTGELALEVALRPPGGAVPFADAAAQSGLDPSEAAQLWRALGFPDPGAAGVSLAADQVEALRFLSVAWHDVLGGQTTLQLARVVGASMASIAESVVDGFRLEVELPRRVAGDDYGEVVRDFVTLASTMFPPFIATLDAVLRRHVVNAARGMWSTDEEMATVTRTRAVGFVDLVGYTVAAHTLSPRALAAAMERFEGQATDLVVGAGGRLVKLIGDEAMFVVEDPAAACELALSLAARFDGDPELPPVRTALAAGPVVALHGDYYGDVVNLAARLVKLADPSRVVVSASVRDAVDGPFHFEPLPPGLLKGFHGLVSAFRLERCEAHLDR